MENDQDKILSFLRTAGPVIPAQVAKHINSNILLASAHLSELSSQGKIKVSHLKVGGSPLYYLPEHKPKLQNFLHNLNPKDQQTLNLLKEKKLLPEKNLDLLTRVSLRNIKDFAVPLNITLNNQKQLFWKWSLLPDQQALELIKSQLSPPQEKPKPEIKPEPEPIKPKPETKKEPLFKEKPGTQTSKTSLTQPKPERKPLLQKLKEKLRPRKKVLDKFTPQLESFFQERNIKIEAKETLRKNAEMNFLLKVPSTVGRITYFCKAKNKKRCDEKDLSAAYIEAQTKKLPLLFLYTHDLSKKAKEMLDSNTFENLMVKKVE